jgi:DNA-binding MarR family transcriptional regulator
MRCSKATLSMPNASSGGVPSTSCAHQPVAGRVEFLGHRPDLPRDLLPRHGIVIAYLDERGSRATELAALSGRHKQRVGRVVDELEALGYVTRTPDPADRRAKLVVPTPRGRGVMRLSDEVMDDIGRRGAQAVGADAYGQFRRTLQRLVDELRDERPPATPAART